MWIERHLLSSPDRLINLTTALMHFIRNLAHNYGVEASSTNRQIHSRGWQPGQRMVVSTMQN